MERQAAGVPYMVVKVANHTTPGSSFTCLSSEGNTADSFSPQTAYVQREVLAVSPSQTCHLN